MKTTHIKLILFWGFMAMLATQCVAATPAEFHPATRAVFEDTVLIHKESARVIPEFIYSNVTVLPHLNDVTYNLTGTMIVQVWYVFATAYESSTISFVRIGINLEHFNVISFPMVYLFGSGKAQGLSTALKTVVTNIPESNITTAFFLRTASVRDTGYQIIDSRNINQTFEVTIEYDATVVDTNIYPTETVPDAIDGYSYVELLSIGLITSIIIIKKVKHL